MKPLLKLINTHKEGVFHIMKVQEPYFFPSWHFHPQYEIMLVLEGTGIRFVGDSVERFQPGDLIFYGANIPHLYRSDEEHYDKRSGLLSQAVVIYFEENFLGESFWNLSDITSIKKLFSLSKKGIKYTGEAKENLKARVLSLDDQKDGIQKIIDLLSVLKAMADTTEFELLSSSAFTKGIEKDDCERMNKVYQFIMDRFAENPSLEQASEIAHMSTTAFCRYFKSHTNKTYTQFLNEIKVGNACKLLIENRLSISQICFETGFNNFTHFNSQFKKISGVTPSQYQNRYIRPKEKMAG